MVLLDRFHFDPDGDVLIRVDPDTLRADVYIDGKGWHWEPTVRVLLDSQDRAGGA